MLKKIAFASLVIPSITLANVADISFWGDEARLSFSTAGDYASTFETEGSYFFSGDRNSKMATLAFTTATDDTQPENNDLLINAGFKIMAIQLGSIKTNTRTEDKNIAALAIGGNLNYDLKLNWRLPVRLVAQIYYSPEVMASSDTTGIIETSTDLELLLNQNAIVYSGYYLTQASLDKYDNQTIGDGVRVGLKIRY